MHLASGMKLVQDQKKIVHEAYTSRMDTDRVHIYKADGTRKHGTRHPVSYQLMSSVANFQVPVLFI